MKKHLLYILIFLLLTNVGNAINFGTKWNVSTGPSFVNGFVTCPILNVRSGPWQKIIGTIHHGDSVKILSSAYQSKWYQISYNGKTGFVYKRHINSTRPIQSSITPTPPVTPTPTSPTTSLNTPGFPFDGFTIASSLNVRTSAWGTIIDRFSKNTNVKVVDKQGKWYRIRHRSGYAWIHSDYVRKGTPQAFTSSTNPGTSQPVTAPVTSGKYTPNNVIGKAGDSKGVKQDMCGRTYDPNKCPNVERWRSLVEKYFKPNKVDLALSIIYRESRGVVTAVNSSSGCTGLFQQHPKYWAARAAAVGCAGAAMTDAEANIAASARLAKQGDSWSHWGMKF